MTKKLEYLYHTADAVEMQGVVYKKLGKSIKGFPRSGEAVTAGD